MTEVSTRPRNAAKSARASKKAIQAISTAPPKSEADQLQAKALQILLFVIADLAESDLSGIPGALYAVNQADSIGYSMCYPNDSNTIPPAPLDGLVLICHHLCAVAPHLETATDADLYVAISASALLAHAQQLAHRLHAAIAGLPGTLEDLRALTTYAGAKPFRERPTPPIRRAGDDSGAAQGRPYQLAKAWSEKTNRLFLVLETAEQSLKAESPNSTALPLLSTVLDQFRDCDEETTLLQALRGQGNADPTMETIKRPYSHSQLVRVLEKIASSAGSLNQTLMQAQQCTVHESELLAVLVDAAQLQAMLIGGMADDASNSEIVGDIQRWFYGPNFGKKGEAA